jgi:hypothetical protein
MGRWHRVQEAARIPLCDALLNYLLLNEQHKNSNQYSHQALLVQQVQLHDPKTSQNRHPKMHLKVVLLHHLNFP